MEDLKSSVQKVGRYVTQSIHFVGGIKRTFEDIDTKTIKQGQFTKLFLKDGRMIMINDQNVLAIEVFESKNK